MSTVYSMTFTWPGDSRPSDGSPAHCRNNGSMASRCFLAASLASSASALPGGERPGSYGKTKGRFSTSNRSARLGLKDLNTGRPLKYGTRSPSFWRRLAAIEEPPPIGHQGLALLIEVAASISLLGLALRPVTER